MSLYVGGDQAIWVYESVTYAYGVDFALNSIRK